MKNKMFIICAILAAMLLCACGSTAADSQAAETDTEATAEESTAAPELTPEPTLEPSPEPTLPPKPDIDIESWEFRYAGLSNGVGRYAPESLVDIEDQYMDGRCAQATRDFLKAARDEGYQVFIGVSYRNFEYNMYGYEKAILKYGSAYEAAKHRTPPGCSEHSLGLAFDITDKYLYRANYYDMHDEEMGDTEVYKWMADHCTDYGFIVRYPEGKEEFYERGCYDGHFRYVGIEAAKYITENKLCLEEFIALYK